MCEVYTDTALMHICFESVGQATLLCYLLNSSAIVNKNKTITLLVQDQNCVKCA